MAKVALIITGSRAHANADLVSRTLDSFALANGGHDGLVLMHGAARGADALAHAWAKRHDVTTLAFAADWERFGKAAGKMRNQDMVDHALSFPPGSILGCVAFPLPGSKGTWDMVGRCKRYGIPVRVVG